MHKNLKKKQSRDPQVHSDKASAVHDTIAEGFV